MTLLTQLGAADLLTDVAVPFRERQPRARRSRASAKCSRSLTFAAVDIQLLMLWSPLRACAPVGAPRRLWSAAECD